MRHKVQSWIRVLRREIRLLRGDFNIIMVILIAPLFYAFFYGSIYALKSEHDVPVAVVDCDHSSLSRELVRGLESTRLVKVAEEVENYDLAVDGLMQMRIHAIVYIPQDFSRSVKSGKSAHLLVYLNASRFLIANDISKAVNEVSETIGAGIKMRFFERGGVSREQAEELIEPLRLEQKALFNPVDSYGDFIIPGLLVMILQQTLLIGLAESMAKEREAGTLPELFRTGGHSIRAVMSGKAAFYLAIYLIYAFVFFTTHFMLFRIPLRGSAAALSALTVLFLLAVVYISLFISSFFRKKIMAMQFFVFTSYPIFLLSGYSWPESAMPPVVRACTQLIPTTPYLQAFTRITQMGAGWRHVSGEIIHLALLAVAGLFATRLRFRLLLAGTRAASATSQRSLPGRQES